MLSVAHAPTIPYPYDIIDSKRHDIAPMNGPSGVVGQYLRLSAPSAKAKDQSCIAA